MDVIRELLAKTTEDGFMERYGSSDMERMYLESIAKYQKVMDQIEKGGSIDGIQ